MPELSHSREDAVGRVGQVRNPHPAAIAPGIVHTAAWERYGLDPDMMGEKMPTNRLQSADDVASLVGFLVSPGGDYISGATNCR